MHRLTLALRHWLARLAVRPPPPDPLASLSIRDFADLPVCHPPAER